MDDVIFWGPKDPITSAAARARAALQIMDGRDLCDYVGQDVTPAVWAAIQAEARRLGWAFDARLASPGVWHITRLEGAKMDKKTDKLIAARDAYSRILADLRAEAERCQLLGLMAERARWLKRVDDLAAVGATLAELSRPPQPTQGELLPAPKAQRGAY